ncbi:acyl-CoA dehydrogenase family protein [Gordonia sp. (in: high G+C Gram-positive bacteria)]|uniref:acyl-CoA dehydrogenase family protein n=1 Tax=Gordonia sp. (in: high G+C Gram-positive bacteria) TaxID=84139 RepID=UPI003C71ACB5
MPTIEPANGVEPELSAMMDAVFADYRRSYSSSSGFDADLWAALDRLGLVRLTGPETSGGSGASWFEAAELLTAAVRHGVRVPLAEHDLLACAVLDDAGLDADDGLVRTLGFLDGNGEASGVPWTTAADRIVLISQSDTSCFVSDLDPSTVEVVNGANIIGEPRATIRVADEILSRTTASASAVEKARLKYAMIRAIQVCAALECAVESAIEHTTTRIQFGKPLARMQVVQSLIADAAAETALARTATESALQVAVASSWFDERLPFLVAVARSCVGHAASIVVRNSHQVHGAIGTTREHRLHEYTRAALAWRGEGGSVRYWDQQVGRYASQAGPAMLWPLIAG